VTGIVSAVLTAFGVSLMVLAPIAALAIVDSAMAVAAGTGMGAAGLAGVSWLYLRDRWRFRRQGPRFPALTRLRFRAVAMWGENRAARPCWTDEDREWLEANRTALPEARRRWP
jgi:hypothetical protein